MCSVRKGVLPDEQGLEMFNGALHGQLAPGNAGFAHAADAFVGVDHDETKGAPFFGQKNFDVGDFHAVFLILISRVEHAPAGWLGE